VISSRPEQTWQVIARRRRGLQFAGPGARHIGEAMENLATLAPYSFDALTSFMEIFRQLLFRPARELNTSALPARALKKVTGLSPREFRAENRPMSARRAREFIVRSGLHGALRVAVLEGASGTPPVKA